VQVFLHVTYRIARLLLGVVPLVFRGRTPKDVELLVLRQENAALSRLIPRARWADVFAITPATILN
jgi:hypothetical protein